MKKELIVAKAIKLLTSEETIVVLLSLILLGCSYLPLAWQYLNPPPGKVFLGSWGFPPDFFGNLTSFQEGRLGHWQHTSKVASTLIAKPTFIRSEYNLLGQLSRLFPLDPVIFFHLCRLFLSITFLLTSYLLISRVLKTKTQRLIAFGLAFFSTTFDPSSKSLTDLWSPLAVFQRSAYYPHYLFSFIFILLAIHFLSQALSQKKPSFLVVASLFGFLAALIHPPTIISAYLSFPFYLALVFVAQLKSGEAAKQALLNKISYLVTFSSISLLPLLYLRQVSSLHPWNLLAKGDLAFNLRLEFTLLSFLIGIGPTAILAIIGAFLVIKKDSDLNLLLAPWSVVYLLGFFFIWEVISCNSARFLQTPFFVILGILSALAINKLATFIGKKYHLNITLVNSCLVFFLLLPNLPAYKQSLKDNLSNFTQFFPYLNTSPERVAAINWLAQNTQEDEIVLASPINGMLISALAGNFPYLTPAARQLENFIVLEGKYQQFFQQAWTEEQARQFVLQEKIKLALLGPEEKNFHNYQPLTYSFLEIAFENNEVTIYRIQP